jgi:ubiquinone biosynthesis protein UbiJ
MGTSPDEIRNEIERTRTDLGQDVDRIVERTSPRRIMRRRTDRVLTAVRDARERIMGLPAEGGRQAANVGHGIAGTAQSAAESVREGGRQVAETAREGTEQAMETARHGVQQAADAVGSAPDMARERAQGNPIGAGVIAFGAGLVLASLLPSAPAERKAGRQLRDHAEDVVEPVKQAAAEPARRLASETGETVRDAAQKVGDAATEAARTTGQQAREQGQELTDHVGESARNVRDEARGGETQ